VPEQRRIDADVLGRLCQAHDIFDGVKAAVEQKVVPALRLSTAISINSIYSASVVAASDTRSAPH
jgi:hypothetical protein